MDRCMKIYVVLLHVSLIPQMKIRAIYHAVKTSRLPTMLRFPTVLRFQTVLCLHTWNLRIIVQIRPKVILLFPSVMS